MHIPFLYYISLGIDIENLVNNQELIKLVIIFVIFTTFMFDSGVILWGEIRSWSLLGS